MASCTELADSDESVMSFLSSAAEAAAGLAPKRCRERNATYAGAGLRSKRPRTGIGRSRHYRGPAVRSASVSLGIP